MAKRVTQARPDWGWLLVDLRMHGESVGRDAYQPPHDLAAAADDIDRLLDHLQLTPAAMLGHSFGGKVAMRWLQTPHRQPCEAWIIDASPATAGRTGQANDMLRIIRQLPKVFDDRNVAIEALVAEGVSKPVAQWMAMNLIPISAAEQAASDARFEGPPSGAMTWRFDVDAIDAMLTSYGAADLWDVVETRPHAGALHIVRGGKSQVIDEQAWSRVVRQAASDADLHAHLIASVGHWVHVEAPDALAVLMIDNLPEHR